MPLAQETHATCFAPKRCCSSPPFVKLQLLREDEHFEIAVQQTTHNKIANIADYHNFAFADLGATKRRRQAEIYIAIIAERMVDPKLSLAV